MSHPAPRRLPLRIAVAVFLDGGLRAEPRIATTPFGLEKAKAGYHRLLEAGAPSDAAEACMIDGLLEALAGADLDAMVTTRQILERVPEVYQAIGRADALAPWQARVRAALGRRELGTTAGEVREDLLATFEDVRGDAAAQEARRRRALDAGSAEAAPEWKLAELRFSLARSLVATGRLEEARPHLIAAFEVVDSGRYFRQRIQHENSGLAGLAYSLFPSFRFVRMRQLADTLDQAGLPVQAALSRGQAAELERHGDATRWAAFDQVVLTLEGGKRSQGLRQLEELLASRRSQAGSPLEASLVRLHEAAAGRLHRLGEHRLAGLHSAYLAWVERVRTEAWEPDPLLAQVMEILHLHEGDDPEGGLRSRLLEAAFDRFPWAPARPDGTWVRTLAWFLSLRDLHAPSGGTDALWKRAQTVLLEAEGVPREVLAAFLEEALGNSGVSENRFPTGRLRAHVAALYGDDPVLVGAWEELSSRPPGERHSDTVERAAARRRWLDAGRPEPPSTSPGWLD